MRGYQNLDFSIGIGYDFVDYVGKLSMVFFDEVVNVVQNNQKPVFEVIQPHSQHLLQVIQGYTPDTRLLLVNTPGVSPAEGLEDLDQEFIDVVNL
jgi:hypothetical protein